MQYAGGGGGAEPATLKFFPLTLTIEIKLCMMLNILLNNLSVEKKLKKIPKFLLLSAFLCVHLSKNLLK